jgi:hypothetical protein
MIRTDYEKNLSKYVRSVDKDKLKTIIKFCGIALRGLDSQYVSMTDPVEIKRVTNSFAAKKLGLTAAAAKKALKAVDKIMRAEKSKMRTTVYYLMARESGTLAKLKPAAPKKAKKTKKAKKVKKAKKAAKPAKKARKVKKAKRTRR